MRFVVGQPTGTRAQWADELLAVRMLHSVPFRSLCRAGLCLNERRHRVGEDVLVPVLHAVEDASRD